MTSRSFSTARDDKDKEREKHVHVANRASLVSRKKKSLNLNKKYEPPGRPEDSQSDGAGSEDDDEIQKQVSGQLQNELSSFLEGAKQASKRLGRKRKMRQLRRLRAAADRLSSPSISTNSIDDDDASDGQLVSRETETLIRPPLSRTTRDKTGKDGQNQTRREK